MFDGEEKFLKEVYYSGDILFRFSNRPIVHNLACMYFLPVQPDVILDLVSSVDDKKNDGLNIINLVKGAYNRLMTMIELDGSNIKKIRKEFIEKSDMINRNYFPPNQDSTQKSFLHRLRIRMVDVVLPLCIYLNFSVNCRFVDEDENGDNIVKSPTVEEIQLLEMILTCHDRHSTLPNLKEFFKHTSIQISIFPPTDIMSKLSIDPFNRLDSLSNEQNLKFTFMSRSFNTFVKNVITTYIKSSDERKDACLSPKRISFKGGDLKLRLNSILSNIPLSMVREVYNLVSDLLKEVFEPENDFYSLAKFQNGNHISLIVKESEMNLMKIVTREMDKMDKTSQEKHVKMLWTEFYERFKRVFSKKTEISHTLSESYKNKNLDALKEVLDSYYDIVQNCIMGLDSLPKLVADEFIEKKTAFREQIKQLLYTSGDENISDTNEVNEFMADLERVMDDLHLKRILNYIPPRMMIKTKDKVQRLNLMIEQTKKIYLSDDICSSEEKSQTYRNYDTFLENKDKFIPFNMDDIIQDTKDMLNHMIRIKNFPGTFLTFVEGDISSNQFYDDRYQWQE